MDHKGSQPIQDMSPKAIRERTGTLIEALPFMHQYSNKTIVIKFGGNAMSAKGFLGDFAIDIALVDQVGAHPVVVHGGGPQIGAMLDRLQIKSDFVDGLRVTDEATISIVEMVLAGGLNKSLVAAIAKAGGDAVGISGKDAKLITARKVKAQRKSDKSSIKGTIDLGFVGEPQAIDTRVLDALNAAALVPVVAPIGADAAGNTYNVNADKAAGSISIAMKAARLLMLTDVPGVLDKKGKLIPELTVRETKKLIKNGTISGGMIPKVETCVDAVENGVEGAAIIDGRVPHALLVELFTEHGDGTMIRP